MHTGTPSLLEDNILHGLLEGGKLLTPDALYALFQEPYDLAALHLEHPHSQAFPTWYAEICDLHIDVRFGGPAAFSHQIQPQWPQVHDVREKE